MMVSVIVPVYNMASDDKLVHCMDSLVRQTLPELEILAVDDCSTDDSLQILRKYEETYPGRVRVFRTDRNRHQGGAKNIGLEHAAGDWIGFIDADDWIVPDYYERLVAKAEETGADVVGTDYSLVSSYTMEPGRQVHNNRPEQEGILDESEEGIRRRRSLIVDFGSLVVKIYRREIVLDCGSRFPEDIFYEDNAIAKTWISRMHQFAYIPEPMYFYLQHADSTVHTVTKTRLQDRMVSGRLMLEEAKRCGYLEKFRPELEYAFTVLFYKNTLFSAIREMKEPGKYRFVTELAKEMKETFPDFQQNPYYRERTDPEEMKYMALQMRSPLLFYLAYTGLLRYRQLRYG
ncbi:MAG: glycosyltransferase family 2 protein [Lachnospiraceae bacterium]|nr:glycosyltransferase family 2 protein [Lachnospiraceae bacterium]